MILQDLISELLVSYSRSGKVGYYDDTVRAIALAGDCHYLAFPRAAGEPKKVGVGK